MCRLYCAFLSIVFILFLSSAVMAAPDGKTEIITDANAGIVRIMIRGKEMLRIDEKGVFVVNGRFQPPSIGSQQNDEKDPKESDRENDREAKP